MIFPTDYRERLIKEQKSRQYRAMLDQQIRQNHIYSKQKRVNIKTRRMKTQALQIHNYMDRRNAEQKQLPHQSKFLPPINTTNIIYHQFKYNPTNESSRLSRQYNSHSNSKHRNQKSNDQSDEQLQKCLQDCSQLIYGINRSFHRINNHIGNKIVKRNNIEDKSGSKRLSSDFQISNPYQPNSYQPNFKGMNRDSKPQLKQKYFYNIGEDVGRNQMMNYNISKAKAKQKQTFHVSTTSDIRNSSITIGKYNKQNNTNSSQISEKQTRKKNIKEVEINVSPNKNNTNKEYNTLNYEEQNQFSQCIYFQNSMQSIMFDSLIKTQNRQRQVGKKQKQRLQAHIQMKKKDNMIIENLRKAKTRGNILFKKIQTFKKQRKQLKGQNYLQTSKLQQKQNSQIKLGIKETTKQTKNKIGEQIKKQIISPIITKNMQQYQLQKKIIQKR